MSEAKVERRHREAAVDALHKAPGILGCRTISEQEWIRGAGAQPNFESEPHQRFLGVVAQALATAEASAQGEAGRTWIAVADKMPLTGVIVQVDGGCAFFDGIGWRTMTGAASGRRIEWPITHWVPLLPPPPKAEP